MARTIEEGREKMSIPTAWLEANFATFVLAGVTAVLVYVTLTLKKATDHLARVSILPKLVLQDYEYHDFGQLGTSLGLNIANKGIATAFDTHI